MELLYIQEIMKYSELKQRVFLYAFYFYLTKEMKDLHVLAWYGPSQGMK